MSDGVEHLGRLARVGHRRLGVRKVPDFDPSRSETLPAIFGCQFDNREAHHNFG
jgi:hypothetical protein